MDGARAELAEVIARSLESDGQTAAENRDAIDTPSADNGACEAVDAGEIALAAAAMFLTFDGNKRPGCMVSVESATKRDREPETCCALVTMVPILAPPMTFLLLPDLVGLALIGLWALIPHPEDVFVRWIGKAR